MRRGIKEWAPVARCSSCRRSQSLLHQMTNMGKSSRASADDANILWLPIWARNYFCMQGCKDVIGLTLSRQRPIVFSLHQTPVHPHDDELTCSELASRVA